MIAPGTLSYISGKIHCELEASVAFLPFVRVGERGGSEVAL